jgi:hypothetical protein
VVPLVLHSVGHGASIIGHGVSVRFFVVKGMDLWKDVEAWGDIKAINTLNIATD